MTLESILEINKCVAAFHAFIVAETQQHTLQHKTASKFTEHGNAPLVGSKFDLPKHTHRQLHSRQYFCRQSLGHITIDPDQPRRENEGRVGVTYLQVCLQVGVSAGG